MASYFTSDSLIEDVKLRGSIPESQDLFSPDRLLQLANDELLLGIAPAIIENKEEYFLKHKTYSLTGNSLSYKIPDRAMGSKLRDVFYLSDAGGIFEMSRINIADLHLYQTQNVPTRNYFYYVENDSINIVNNNMFAVTGAFLTGNIRMFFYERPNKLVASTRIAIVTSIINNTTVQVNAVPSVFSLANKYDLIQASSPFKSLDTDLIPVSINSTTKQIEFSSTISDRLSVGDHVCLAEECYIPQIPTELHSLLSQRVMARCMEAMGDAQGLQLANVKIAEMEKRSGALVSSRVEGSQMKVVNKHSSLRRYNSFLRRRSRF